MPKVPLEVSMAKGGCVQDPPPVWWGKDTLFLRVAAALADSQQVPGSTKHRVWHERIPGFVREASGILWSGLAWRKFLGHQLVSGLVPHKAMETHKLLYDFGTRQSEQWPPEEYWQRLERTVRTLNALYMEQWPGLPDLSDAEEFCATMGKHIQQTMNRRLFGDEEDE